MNIKLQTPYTRTVTASELNVAAVVDNPRTKVVLVHFLEFRDPLVLWSGGAYDAAGQWTDADVAARIAELLGKIAEDQEAISWARTNAADPRSKQILALHGLQS